MTLVLHRGLVIADPLRIDHNLLVQLFIPYTGRPVVFHIFCEELRFSWKGKGTLRASPLGGGHGWRLVSANDPTEVLEVIPFDHVVGHECLLSIVPEIFPAKAGNEDELLAQVRALADLLDQVKRS